MSNESSHQRNTTEILPESKPEMANSVPSADEAEALYATARRLQETGDNDKAADCYEKAALLGYAPALEALCEIAHRLRESGDEDRAVICLLKAAEQGCLKVQYTMLNIRSDKVTIKFCRKAAEQGYAPAQRLLGMRAGLSAADATLWLHRAAAQGDVEAALMLGNGASETELPDMEALREALRRYPVIRRHPLYMTFEKAIRGFSEAQRELAALYEKGRDVSLNAVIAEKWYERAALQGDAKAMMKFAEICSRRYDYSDRFRRSPSDYKKAIFWFVQAGLRGHESAFYRAGCSHSEYSLSCITYYINSLDEAFSCSLALECLKRASAQGDESASDAFKRCQAEVNRFCRTPNYFEYRSWVFAVWCVIAFSFLFMFALDSKPSRDLFIIYVGCWVGACLGSFGVSWLIERWIWRQGYAELKRAAAAPIDNLDEAVRSVCDMSPEIKQETIYPAPEEGLEIKEPRTAEKSTDSGKSSFER